MSIILVPISIIIGFLCSMAVRNQLVFRYRSRLLDLIPPGHPEFRKLMDEFRSVLYTEMVSEFWRPLDSFYQGTDLLKLKKDAE